MQDKDTSMPDQNQPPPSLISSFSTTDSAPSDYARQAIADLIHTQTDTQETAQPQAIPMAVNSSVFGTASTSTSALPTQTMPTVLAYDAWSKVYDSDGNMLQGVDDMELESWMPDFLSQVVEQSRTAGAGTQGVRIADMGCGTGRNTTKLLGWDGWPKDLDVEVVGIDASRGMLDIAAPKLASLVKPRRRFALHQHDFLSASDPTGHPIPFSSSLPPFDAAISTLVLEHFPLRPFFVSLSSLLRPNGIALVTNMHHEMGSISQAGFVSTDAEGNAIKVRAGTSWIHDLPETVKVAQEAGFEVLDVRERAVEDKLVARLGNRAAKWVGVKVWYGLAVMKVC
jgi:SAM-dependent methyltransferase